MASRLLSRSVLGLLVAGLIFAAILSIVDAGAVFAALRNADLRLVLGVAVVLVCWNVAWGLALWQVLATQDLGIGVSRAILYHAASAFSNHVTPLGQAGGEPITAYIISSSSDTDYEVSLAAVASFDALHIIPSLTFAAIGAFYLLGTGTTPSGDLFLLSVGVIAAAVALPVVATALWLNRTAIAGRLGPRVNGLVRRVLGAIPGRTAPDFHDVEARLVRFATAIERVGTDRRRLVAALTFSALGWVLQSLSLWLALLAVSAPVPLYVPLVAVPLGATGGGVPTPGGLGGNEAVYVATLTLLTGVGAATVTAAVAIHATGGYLLTTSLGAGAVGVLGIENVY